MNGILIYLDVEIKTHKSQRFQASQAKQFLFIVVDKFCVLVKI